MEQNWERSSDFIQRDKSEIEQVFTRFNAALRVLDFHFVLKGCRCSNYIVETSGGKFFLRFPADSRTEKNEQAAFTLLGGKINLPALLYSFSENGQTTLIYEYVDSVPLDDMIAKTGAMPDEIIRQAAKTAAVIHNHTPPDGLFFQEDIPPFFSWYGYFLSNPAVRERLGEKLADRIESHICTQQENMEKIESDKTLIHCDFKTANMIVTPDGRLYITDWEFTGPGHRVSDIGQFFRDRAYFRPKSFRIFEKEYNTASNTALTHNWYQLCRLRDLANLLEMIGRKEDTPVKFSAIKETVRSILDEAEDLS